MLVEVLDSNALEFGNRGSRQGLCSEMVETWIDTPGFTARHPQQPIDTQIFINTLGQWMPWLAAQGCQSARSSGDAELRRGEPIEWRGNLPAIAQDNGRDDPP